MKLLLKRFVGSCLYYTQDFVLVFNRLLIYAQSHRLKRDLCVKHSLRLKHLIRLTLIRIQLVIRFSSSSSPFSVKQQGETCWSLPFLPWYRFQQKARIYRVDKGWTYKDCKREECHNSQHTMRDLNVQPYISFRSFWFNRSWHDSHSQRFTVTLFC